jgi:septal ring factor EnvC (AmiA/AmiB activator)
LFDHHLLILLSRAKAGLIADLKNRVAEQGRLAEAAQAKTAELTKVEDALRGSRADLQAKQQTRQQLLARSLEQIKARRREIGGLERDEQRLGKLIADLAARRPRHATTKPPKARPAAPTAATVPDPTIVGGAFAALKGRLPYPVRGQIGNRFGMQRPEGGAPWKGVFFRAPEGAEVRTVAAGEIAYADWMRGFGNLLIAARRYCRGR